ncbi:hypothetical protein DOABOMFO_00059 [Enterococcus phage EF_KTM]|nr:hypothetical protein DDLHHHOO_00040 [Enterococcus phage EF_RCK]WVH07321.1 hypothetical protein AIMFIBHH_00031 [Enterococcus phage EF_TR1]
MDSARSCATACASRLVTSASDVEMVIIGGFYMKLRDLLNAAEFDRMIVLKLESGHLVGRFAMNNHIEYTREWEGIDPYLDRQVTLISTTTSNDLYIEVW